MDVTTSKNTLAQHLDALRKRLIDISNRNKLVNFRPTKKACIELATPEVGTLYTELIEGEVVFQIRPGVEYLINGTRSKRKKPGVAADPILPSRGDVNKAIQQGRILCLHDEGDLEARADYLRREAKAVLDETGINHLYLALGFLRWREREDSEEERRSPLLLVPINVSRRSEARKEGDRIFAIEHDGGDLFPNLSLIERLRNDFGIELPRFGEESTDADEYLADVARIVKSRRGWQVEYSAFISFFSFAKLRMYVDLDPSKWPEGHGLLENPLVQQVLEGSMVEPESGTFGGVEVTDGHPIANDIPLVVEADSSQHTAVLKAWEGKNLVIEGPPGTGKSQTITNIIAAALHQGKSVLFVSEKLAALEVVKRNLDAVGLGELCLELHSHKTRKQEVHSSIGQRIRWRPPTNNRFEATLREWRGHVDRLHRYLEACGTCLGPREEEIFRLMGRAIQLREKSIPAVRDPLSRLDLDGQGFQDALTCLKEIGLHLRNPEEFRDHPWSGFLCERTKAGDELAIRRHFETLAVTLDEAVVEARQFEQYAGSGASPLPNDIERLNAPGTATLPQIPESLASDILSALVTDTESAELGLTIDNADAHREHLAAAGKTLSSGAIDRGGLGEWLKNASAAAISQRLGDISIAALHENLPAVLEVAALASEAVQIAAIINDLELGSAATIHDLERFLTRLHVCGSAPSCVSELLSPEHRFPHAEAARLEAESEAQQLENRRKELEVTFVVSDSPNPGAVQELRKRLRATGGRWISFVNRDYREARKATLSFLRTRKHFVFPAVLDALESLEQWQQQTTEFAGQTTLRQVLGPGFSGVSTEWTNLGETIQWTLAMTREALPWSVIAKLATAANQVKLRDVTARLESLLQRLVAVSDEASIVLDAIFDGRSCRALEINELKLVTAEWSEWLRQTLDAVFPVSLEKNVTFSNLKAAAEHLLESERLARSIENSTSFQRIAGSHARGLDSDWKLLKNTRQWVERVRLLSLPQALFQWLMDSDAGARIEAATTVIGKLRSILIRCSGILESIETFGTIQRDWLWGSEEKTWTGRAERIRSIQAKSYLLQQWALFRQLYRQADKLAAKFAVDEVLKGTVPPDQAHEAFDLAVNEYYGYDVLRTYRELETFTHDSRVHLAKSFRETDRELLRQARILIAQRAANRRNPSGNGVGSVASWTEWPLLQNEVNKQKRHIPIRQLLRRAGRSVLAWKPCLMMSPLSVAQYLDPRCAPFDLVVMDEASQIRPEDALGAVARARQIVVVGDTKQMPPSNYWSRALNDEDDEEEDEAAVGRGVAQDSESILECAKNAFPPAQRLLWHYRSQHESLIRFSNYAYYDEELIVFPAASDEKGKLGIRFHHLPDGRYKTGARVNEEEAITVARAALDHLIHNPGESLLVATFNKPQQDLIESLVEKFAAEDLDVFERLEEARQHPKEPFVVKNLENVQGDERDVVFVSCTYGPDSNTGVVMQRFGPVAGAAGRRRLNVLFTRAKRRMELFSSMSHEQILGKPGEASGVNDLRDYLRFAQTGVLSDRGQRTDLAPDSYFEEAVMRVVESTGLRAVPQVGVSSYRIDIGVEDPSRPGEFILGIECDGAMYHSSKSSRDRDRLRQEVLERRGWKIHRIWSTDWFRQNEAAKQRLISLLRTLS